MRYFGAHVSSAGGHNTAVENANVLNINSIQMMPTPPMMWSVKEISIEQVERFVNALDGSTLKKLLLHCVYLINLARGDSKMFGVSKQSILTYVKYAQEIMNRTKEMDFEVLGATFHPGSAKDLSDTDSIKRISQGLNEIIDQTPGDAMILLESSAGAGSVMGDKLEELALMREGVEKKERIGYVLDTQHMFVSGYDWTNDLDNIVNNIDSVLGLNNVKCFHLNDSMMDMGSHKDRHANLGEGKIGINTITNIVNHPKLVNIPFILETPGLKSNESAKIEVEKLRSIIRI